MPIRAHAPGLSHGGANFHGEIELRAREAFRGIFEDHLRFRDARHLPLYELYPLQSEIDDLLAGLAKNHPALKRAGGIVEVEDGPLGARNGIHGAGDQLFPSLAEHLNGDGLGDAILRDDLANEIKIRLRCRGEAHLDFLKAKGQQQIPKAELFLGPHGIDEGLVTIPKVHAAPPRRLRDGPAGPLAIGQIDGLERPVFLKGHSGIATTGPIEGIATATHGCAPKLPAPARGG